MHVLIIEDQAKLAENMRQFLELEHYAVTVCGNGADAFELAMTRGFDLIILDVNLPGMDGFSLCAQLRQAGKTVPVLMLTARAKQKEIVHGLDIGADDYLTKPFDLDELLARVRALLRRNGQTKDPVLSADDVQLDAGSREVFKDGRRIPLSPKEFALLHFLLMHKGVAQDRPKIIEHVWGGRDELMFSQTVDVHVAYLRRKLGKNVVKTVPGKGYMIPNAA